VRDFEGSYSYRQVVTIVGAVLAIDKRICNHGGTIIIVGMDGCNPTYINVSCILNYSHYSSCL